MTSPLALHPEDGQTVADGWLRRALDALPDGVAIFATPCTGPAAPPADLLSGNGMLAELLGQPLKHLLGQGWVRQLPSAEAQLIATQIARAARDGQAPAIELSLGHEGSMRRLSLTVSAMPPCSGEAPGLLAVLRDVTAQREAERSGLETERLRAVADLSAEVSHALTNQLTVMAGALDLIQELDPPDLPRPPLMAALRATAQATALLRRLQALSRHDPPRAEPLAPLTLLPSLVERLRPLLPEGATLDWHVAPETPRIFCDPRHLETALLSVAMGGLDPIGACAMVLSAAPSGQGVRLCLGGLAPAGATARRDLLSDLLSAAVSRRFAARSGGHFEPTADGACFTLPGPGAASAPMALAGALTGGILIVTADARLQATLLAQAESLGYRANAMGATAALDRVAAAPREFSLVLIDSELAPPLRAANLARALAAIEAGLTILPVGELPPDWPSGLSGRLQPLPFLPSLRDFAETVGAALSQTLGHRF
ncbi:PAS domain-containing protein [Acetobacteraceae bacterium H6797]|nr:PAS domain-containing protein [Acetobacteraceae bacterium H6797]